MRIRIARLALVGALFALALPATAVGAPPEGSCAGEIGTTQVMAVPAAFRTEGVHRLERHYFVTLTDGTVEDWGIVGNQIEISSSAPAYDNVLIRVVSNAGLLPDGTIERPIFAMRPDQKASFYSQFSWARWEPIASVKVLLRYETRKNQWSAWTELPSSSQTSFCRETKDSVFRKSYGWAG